MKIYLSCFNMPSSIRIIQKRQMYKDVHYSLCKIRENVEPYKYLKIKNELYGL